MAKALPIRLKRNTFRPRSGMQKASLIAALTLSSRDADYLYSA